MAINGGNIRTYLSNIFTPLLSFQRKSETDSLRTVEKRQGTEYTAL
jgi:hypothetical protein